MTWRHRCSWLPWVVTLALGLFFAQEARASRELSFEARVAAEEAIERAYVRHRSGTQKRFEELISEAVLERRVRAYLDRSSALESYWGRPITGAMLEREMQRIVRDTKMPGRLQELYAALGGDAFLFQECVVRRVLAERLSRSLFSWDSRIHGERRAELEALRGRIERGGLSPGAAHSWRMAASLVRAETDLSEGAHEAGGVWELPAESYDRLRRSLPVEVGHPSAIRDDGASFSFRVLLAESPGRQLEVAEYRLAKRMWEEWWSEAGPAHASEIHPVALETASFPEAASADDCSGNVLDDEWHNGILGMLPEASWSTAVWTGSEMIVWGGDLLGVTPVEGGARYDPLVDAWTEVSAVDAPAARGYHTAVWTGSEMIVWGGASLAGFLNDGGRYDPQADTWTVLPSAGAPSARIYHTAVWTGEEMIVWGGQTPGGLSSSGRRYDPESDSWAPTSTVGSPSARRGHTAVWTGSEMIVWGGAIQQSKTASGGRYDPASDTWVSTKLTGAPVPRDHHTAVWTGDEMVVFGGEGTTPLSSGARYRFGPGLESWTALPAAPAARDGHAAVWTGTEMIAWGGIAWNGSGASGARWSRATNAWTVLPDLGLGEWEDEHTLGVWTGSEMIVWHRGQGGRYDPLLNAWTPVSHPVDLVGRLGHTAVWTGNEMIVWGGQWDDTGPLEMFNTGGRYDPVLDSWSTTTLASAPTERSEHTAVWTGEEMIVWGGATTLAAEFATGGRYDPLVDSWSPTSLVGAPGARTQHSAVWTGNEMIVWGGTKDSVDFNTGGRYDPVNDSWLPTSVVNAPEARHHHSAVWTGEKMIVWGGGAGPGGQVDERNTGGRYDPVSDSWTPTSLVGAPEPRLFHSAVWIGSEMVIWGGRDGPDYLNTGGRYDPAHDTWLPTPLAEVPSQRSQHVAVWTGSEMIVWGGGAIIDYPQSGGRLDPTRGAWFTTTELDAPPGRKDHTAVWTGEALIAWGGLPNAADPGLHTGGIYFAAADGDGDGVVNACDCAAEDPGVFSPPSEIGNVRWDDALTLVWDSDTLNSGPATRYDVLRGSLAGLPVGGPGELCLAMALEDTSLVDPDAPSAGAGFFYLVRGHNVCGSGSYGTSSDGQPRTTAACP